MTKFQTMKCNNRYVMKQLSWTSYLMVVVLCNMNNNNNSILAFALSKPSSTGIVVPPPGEKATNIVTNIAETPATMNNNTETTTNNALVSETTQQQQQQQTQQQQQQTQQQQLRPAYVLDILQKHENSKALEKHDDDDNDDNSNHSSTPLYLYYFGIGSNMLRSKIENRGYNGSKIEIESIEPAYVIGHRLAFNMKGFPPLEPGMGSLEPVNSDSKALFAYKEPQCHGALVKVTPENYEKIMRSEGVGLNNMTTTTTTTSSTTSKRSKNTSTLLPGYEEVVVTAIPYNTSLSPVTAIALRARSHVRLYKDATPSVRYMNILKEGAKELNLIDSYQQFLIDHPIQYVPTYLKRIALNNLIGMSIVSANAFSGTSSGRRKWIRTIQSWLLFRVYVRCTTTTPWIQSKISEWLTALLLLPVSIIGSLYRLYIQKTNQQLTPMIQRFVTLLSSDDNNKNNTNNNDNNNNSDTMIMMKNSTSSNSSTINNNNNNVTLTEKSKNETDTKIVLEQ